MEKLTLRPYTKPERQEHWTPEEQVPVSLTLSKVRFNKFRWIGKRYGLSMRQVLNQMIDYAEANMEMPNV